MYMYVYFSSLKLVYIFSVNQHLGPLQVSLSRMVMDIIKWAFLDLLVLFAFSCGLNQLLWYYSDLEKKQCDLGKNLTSLMESQSRSPDGLACPTLPIADPDACFVWRRFAKLVSTNVNIVLEPIK